MIRGSRMRAESQGEEAGMGRGVGNRERELEQWEGVGGRKSEDRRQRSAVWRGGWETERESERERERERERCRDRKPPLLLSQWDAGRQRAKTERERERKRPSASPRPAQWGGEGLKRTATERIAGGEAETVGYEEGKRQGDRITDRL